MSHWHRKVSIVLSDTSLRNRKRRLEGTTRNLEAAKRHRTESATRDVGAPNLRRTKSATRNLEAPNRRQTESAWRNLEAPNRRRTESATRNLEAPNRRQTEGEAGQKVDYAPEPIGFKALEKICSDEAPENAILELVNKAERFEALLCLEKIRPDLLKLAIASFRMLCTSSTIVAANAEKLLRSPKVKIFITGPILSRFINEMPYLGDLKLGTVINDLAVTFVAMMQRFGENIVHDLPLPQLSVSLASLKEQKLIEDIDALEKKVQEAKDLKDELIRQAKTAHDSQAEPPQNFRDISVIPDAVDFLFSRPFLRENITDRKFKDLDHYLDVQFRLLREDFVMPLRDGIKQLRKESRTSLEPSSASNARRAKDVSAYFDVTVLSTVYSEKGRLCRIRFNHSHRTVKRVNWDRSKRLKYGSLVCLSSDDFNSFILATVHTRDANGLKVGELEVRFDNVESALVNTFIQEEIKFVMVESPAYFEAYRHVLEALKEIKSEEFPFQRHIVECCQDVRAPEYHLQLDNEGREMNAFSFDFSSLLVKKTPPRASDEYCDIAPLFRPAVKNSENETRALSQTASMNPGAATVRAQDESAGVSTHSSTSLEVAMDIDMPRDIFNWPDKESLGFNESQMRAFKLALTKQFAVIQGPPGTGKTFVGLKIAQALLQNASLWKSGKKTLPILMVSYTNHALDQFLEGLLPMSGIVRVGGRCKNQKLERCRLKILKANSPRTATYGRRVATRREIRAHKNSFQRSSHILKASRSGVISLDVFMADACIRPDHYNQFFEMATEWGSMAVELLNWLFIEISNRSQYREGDDDLIEVATPGFSFDDDEGFQRHDNAALWEIAILAINDAEDPENVRRNLVNNEAMTENREHQVHDINGLNIGDRWRLYRLWRQRLENRHRERLQGGQEAFEEAILRDEELEKMEVCDVLQNAQVIGMTTTCAAKYRHVLQQIRPKIVLIEEAAEVLEAHIITSLTKGCQHLILIGDHQQLRPTPAVYELAKKYKLDVSLFERMINVGVQYERLSVQYRMRPEISALLKHIYEDLENHESVERYEDIKGLKKNMFFINHSHLESHNGESYSHTNEHEATFLVSLCNYLLQQGYKANQITLLTTYMGQMFTIRDCLEKNAELKSVRLTTVDNFQGEENDIVLLSLVRSNMDEKVGFISITNRACVALSRAKMGFYCIGNFDLLSKHSDIWSKIVADLKVSDSIGTALPLTCQIHSNEITAEKAEDFSKKAPEGGCLRRCEGRLDCGHACKLLCHPRDVKHKNYVCLEPCARSIAVGCSHLCPNHCGEPCERFCEKLVEKVLPECGHIAKVKCGKDVWSIPCREQCSKILSCGHNCQSYCNMPCTTECKELVKRSDWQCGHEVTIACSATPADCPVPCEGTLECGHQCKGGTCGKCLMGRVHQRCKMKCGRPLVCSHLCKEACTTPCPPCSRNCENRCIHSKCNKKCSEPCKPCMEPCSWGCRHYKCAKRCHEICDRPRCNVPCGKFLECYHDCRGLMCEENHECICVMCTLNDETDPITKIFLGGEEDEDSLFIRLPDCGHIFAVSDLDRYMDMVDDATDDRNESHVIQMKRCPRCRTTIRLSLRYGKVIKQQLQDIEKVKSETNQRISSGLFKKTTVLKKRLYNLSAKFSGQTYESIWATLEHKVSKLRNGLMVTLLENNVTLTERFCSLIEKWKENMRDLPLDVCKENNLDGPQMASELSYLLKRFMSDGVTQRELKDINTEFSRLNFQLELCLLSHDIKSEELELKEPSLQTMNVLREKLSGSQRIEDETLDELMKDLETIRRAQPELNPLTPEEKKQIKSAIGLSKGHWFKCPKGHIYAIGECGGAMERSTCPECKAEIGGENHKLEEGNEVAPEMDGARYAAWSEQANLQNYEL